MKMDKVEEERIAQVLGVCVWCGRFPHGGCEVGIIAVKEEGFADDTPLAFCDYDCLSNWNVAHGYGPNGDVELGNGPEAQAFRLSILQALNQYPNGWHKAGER